jgi:undecaprenyl-diphosphooligosaccharide---protein glycotransferase
VAQQPAGSSEPLDMRLTAALALAAFGLCCGLRLLDISRVLAMAPGPDGAPLLTTHDSYAWLAGAAGINQYSDSLLAIIVRCLHGATGLAMETIAFWLPAVMAPLACLPMCLLAAWWRLPEAAPVAATLAAASLGFLVRTKIGVFDTDVLTLFFPVAMAVWLIIWLEPLMVRPLEHGAVPNREKIYLHAFGIGLLFRAYLQYYPSGQTVGLSVLGCAALPALSLARQGLRYDIAASLALVFLAGAGSMYGLLAAAVIASCAAYRPGLFAGAKIRLAVAALLAVAAFLSFDAAAPRLNAIGDIIRYSRINLKQAGAVLPSTIKSVGEAQPLSILNMVDFVAGNWVLFIAGIAGFAYCLWRRPAAFVFAPLLALGLAGTQLGARFTMYGGPAMGMGLGCGIALALKNGGVKSLRRWLVLLGLLAAVIWPVWQHMNQTKPEAIFELPYIRALQDVRDRAAPGAQLWVWWGFGYAAQYYSRRMTFADGSRNTGEYTVPLARLYFAASLRYAGKLMAFTACRQKAAGLLPSQSPAESLYANPFMSLLHSMPPAESQALLSDMENMQMSSCGGLPEQYLAVSWETVKRARTISSDATWNLETGASDAGRIIPIAGNAALDRRQGELIVDGAPHEARAAAILTENRAELFSWPTHAGGPCILANRPSREMFAVDEAIYGSLMVQMLIAEPKTFEPCFTLVADRLPDARVYRLNPDACVAADGGPGR